MAQSLMTQGASPPDLSAIERVIVAGDLSKLSQDERWQYYAAVCRSLDLNPYTTPFAYIMLNQKLTLYALKGATDQLRGKHHISVSKPALDLSEGLCIVSVTATDATGRQDSDLGITSIEGLKGEARANAIMKAITKAKRRVTLSMLGLGMLDESEIDSIPGAQTMSVTMPPAAAHARAWDEEQGEEVPFPDMEPIDPPSAEQLATYQRGIRRATELDLDCAPWEIRSGATATQVQAAIDSMRAAVRAKEASAVRV